ncbi:MAG: aspartate aminotransferase [bacterium (Candidatus Ratteibacteria) CG_4_10_14_3_um_filter_41_18]|uniref:Aminotransferase n=4 Tax=Candidatus Ratteibacteria TaxID=2979319 RepID=A0A2M7YEM1_9BACT|nr:MAG: aspartate aminotransferase [bacterium (Candidatus Ratteibacteria) CG01_land_8_20_14_3_00_40_19]PIX77005.1 MAG: aspartate aminotransferase [bacterium (Candidatus Ratteibacteria) CG_4_10_14_3_um_filter_41_18]PJA61432.1 MAG: aspartate aminotransferase [bacterium (Candidatus Ratteibacteria) CG_4_9_14_3_um_filter_41_21]HCG77070.1 aspartate aminotransferase [bacterium]
MSIAKRISLIETSLTLAISAQAKAMKGQGINVIDFGAGEPDFDTPAYIKEAAEKAIEEGFTKYTPVSGTRELKEAIAEKFKNDNHLNYSPEEILVSCGAKHSIYNAIVSLCDEGDEVILPSPYWLSYPEMIKIAGASPVIIETDQENGFKITPEQLKRAITPKTKLFILNSPSNPTGAVYGKEELLPIREILVKTGIYCISDEIYEKIIYNGQKHTSLASLGQEINKLTITVNGVSKSYAMTGWRIGYAGGAEEIIQAMDTLQSHSTSNPASISQKAALAALKGPQKETEKMVAEFARRRDFIMEKLDSIKQISCLKPRGAFYLFANISKLKGKSFRGKIITDSVSLAAILLAETRVAAVPGKAFGADNYLRFSYATSLDNIEEGLKRIKQFIEQII